MGRRKYTPKEKLGIVFEGLSNPDSISEVCRRKGISTVQFYQWKDKLIKSAPEIFNRRRKKSVKEIEDLNELLKKKDSVIARITEENLELKKNLGI